jgi:hypothetical protein
MAGGEPRNLCRRLDRGSLSADLMEGSSARPTRNSASLLQRCDSKCYGAFTKTVIALSFPEHIRRVLLVHLVGDARFGCWSLLTPSGPV